MCVLVIIASIVAIANAHYQRFVFQAKIAAVQGLLHTWSRSMIAEGTTNMQPKNPAAHCNDANVRKIFKGQYAAYGTSNGFQCMIEIYNVCKGEPRPEAWSINIGASGTASLQREKNGASYCGLM